MPTELTLGTSADTLPPVFQSYEVSAIGIVEGHEDENYLVRVPSGALHGYRSPSGTPSEALAAEEIAYAIANTPAFPVAPRRQTTRVIVDRLTAPEKEALFNSTHVAVKTLVAKALATGAIRDDDPDFPAAVAGLDALGIIENSRWEELLAP